MAPKHSPAPFHSLKLPEWPEADRVLFERACQNKGGLFRRAGPGSHWRNSTIETVAYRYGVFLWWLGATGRPGHDASALERASLQNIEAFVEAYGACHASTSLLGTLHGVHEALRAMYPEADLSELRGAVAAIKATAKARPKASRLTDQGSLIALAEALIAHGAKRVDEGHMLSALAIRDGLLILLLVCCPLRRTNVAGLRIGTNLFRDDHGLRIELKDHETKTHQPFDALLDEFLEVHFDLYIERARPILQARSNQPDEGWLWLGEKGQRVTGKALSRRVRELTSRHLGRPMSMHLFRDCAATTVALHDSPHIGIVASVLQHARHDTSERHYNQARSFDAFRRYQDLVESITKQQ